MGLFCFQAGLLKIVFFLLLELIDSSLFWVCLFFLLSVAYFLHVVGLIFLPNLEIAKKIINYKFTLNKI